jgi:hypothetical protein
MMQERHFEPNNLLMAGRHISIAEINIANSF